MAIKSIGAIFEISKLLIEIFKLIRAETSLAFSKEAFRNTSTLTTLEFRRVNDQQVSYFVQDRQIVFTKPGALPPFQFWSEGTNLIDELLVDNISVAFREVPGEPGQFVPQNHVQYEKGDQVKAALLARSVDGYRAELEWYSLKVERWVGRSGLAIVFPEDKKPLWHRIFYRMPSDAANVERHTNEVCELKKTTCSRWVLLWESKNLKPGRTYTLQWRWDQAW